MVLLCLGQALVELGSGSKKAAVTVFEFASLCSECLRLAEALDRADGQMEAQR
jgi:hypothetical protein